MLSTGNGKSVWHVPHKKLSPQKSLPTQSKNGSRDYVSTCSSGVSTTQHLICLLSHLKLTCWPFLFRIKDALLKADQDPHFQIKWAKGKACCLSEAKKHKEAYTYLTGRGFEVWCLKLTTHLTFKTSEVVYTCILFVLFAL